ncbi:hypothetical protein PAXRUDRAFT_768207 [Paxillus rubicundulus Ve08.2h10]|uniref:Uncharacterized protein n=1 Tax=Paxillus rubicundulus Ve08.2h10 TaxID=930991 RepID=A0A0D0DMP7_9AGAM|nr:hypothetical protein PAXRUDRAFT_768207 [Paxillus rubicundulus Ve08.2h10]
MVSSKAKVICKVIYEQHIAQEQQLDQEQISMGQWESPQDMSAIVGTHILGNGTERCPLHLAGQLAHHSPLPSL